jgi:UDP-2,3-diacylglucosamine pyrophosphatase LpxH
MDQKIFQILGNHDIFITGWTDFRDNVGPSVYWFEVVFTEGKDLYISLDTATATLGRKQTEWLRSFLTENRSRYRHCIILTHTNFFYSDMTQASSGNMPIEECFSLIDFFEKQNVSLVLQGHDHFREDLTYGKVRYIVLGAIREDAQAPEYLKITVSKDKISLDWQLI